MADDRIEIEIVLDDGSIQKGFAKLNTEADKSASKAGKSFTKSFGGAFTRLRKSALGAFAGIGAVLAGGAGLRAATQNLVEFQQRFEEIKTIIPNVAQANGELNASLIESAQIFGTSAADQARTFYQIISAGITDASEANKVLIASNKLAIGGLATQAEAVNILTSAINSFGAQNLSAARAADILFAAVRVGKTRVDLLANSLGQILPSAKAIGVSFEDTAAAIATLTTRGLSTSEAVTQLNAVFTALLRKQALAKSFGKTVQNAFSLGALEKKGLTTFLKDLNKAVGGSGEALIKLLGRVEGVRAILTLSGDNFVALSRNVDSLKNSAGAATTAFETINLTLGQQLKVLTATFSGEILKLSQSVEGPLISAVMALTSSINFLSKNAAGISSIFREVTVTIAAFMIGLRAGPMVFKAFEIAMFGMTRNLRVVTLALELFSWNLGLMGDKMRLLKVTFLNFPFVLAKLGFRGLINSINLTKIAVIGLRTAVNLLKVSITLGLIFAVEWLLTKFFEIKRELGGIANLFDLLGLSIKKSFMQALVSTSELLLLLEKIPGLGPAIENVFGGSIRSMGENARVSIVQTDKALNELYDNILRARDELKKPFQIPPPPPIPKGGGPLGNVAKSVDEDIAAMEKRVKALNEAVRRGFARALSSGVQAFVTALVKGENALEAFGKAFIGVIGDLAIQLGTMIVASSLGLMSLFSGDPAGGIAFGLGLIAIGSLLKALSGGGFEGAGVGPGNDSVTAPILGDDLTDSLQNQGPKVQVTIEGNIFDSDSTGLRIAEILREQGLNNAVIS
jgi:TP901 family phage tail tape measure protein